MARYYQGQAEVVVCQDTQGRVMHIHPRYFRPHLTRDGVNGWFLLRLNSQGQFVELRKESE